MPMRKTGNGWRKFEKRMETNAYLYAGGVDRLLEGWMNTHCQWLVTRLGKKRGGFPRKYPTLLLRSTERRLSTSTL